MKMNKKGLEFTFGWMFALIVGAVILFLAIYATIRIISSERTVQETGAAKQIDVILTPIETGYEEAKSVAPIIFPSEARIYNNCTNNGNFGEQTIRVATSLDLGKTWQDDGLPITSYNKYIFSPIVVQGKEVYVFSKPFSMPFKIANLLFMWSDKYCLISPPVEIEKEVNSLSLQNINTTDDINKCSKDSKKVCFISDLDRCDIFVDPLQQVVRHKGKKPVFYQGSLIYGAIFSEPEVYECQFQRLMKRGSELALLYNAKSEIIASESNGCSSDLQSDLKNLASLTKTINSSLDINSVYFSAGAIKDKNDKIADCKLWQE